MSFTGGDAEHWILFIEGQRCPTTYYTICQEQVHVFAFEVYPYQCTKLTITHTAPLEASQDYSLQAWFSNNPLDYELFAFQDNYVSPIGVLRRAMTIPIYDKNIVHPSIYAPDRCKLALDPGTYYFNVKNLQNRVNNYRLQFS
jgi:hypothetical protein